MINYDSTTGSLAREWICLILNNGNKLFLYKSLKFVLYDILYRRTHSTLIIV